mmetsp:Transcript_123502/g.357102  ORF Transcript_123502/g.357102 Transcript_123502/m.357102 type:complete len:224 (+) Transcript_123502:255-926(+)
MASPSGDPSLRPKLSGERALTASESAQTRVAFDLAKASRCWPNNSRNSKRNASFSSHNFAVCTDARAANSLLSAKWSMACWSWSRSSVSSRVRVCSPSALQQAVQRRSAWADPQPPAQAHGCHASVDWRPSDPSERHSGGAHHCGRCSSRGVCRVHWPRVIATPGAGSVSVPVGSASSLDGRIGTAVLPELSALCVAPSETTTEPPQSAASAPMLRDTPTKSA